MKLIRADDGFVELIKRIKSESNRGGDLDLSTEDITRLIAIQLREAQIVIKVDGKKKEPLFNL
jgi:hypothetical protein